MNDGHLVVRIATFQVASGGSNPPRHIFRISNLIGKGFPCHGNRCRFDSDLIRK